METPINPIHSNSKDLSQLTNKEESTIHISGNMDGKKATLSYLPSPENSDSLHLQELSAKPIQNYNIKAVQNTNEIPDTTLVDILLERSEAFFNNKSFGSLPKANRIATLLNEGILTKEAIAEHMESTHPIITQKTYKLLSDFLENKKLNGTRQEKNLYTNTILTPEALIHRLLTKRPYVFFGGGDTNLLRSGHYGNNFQILGTDKEHASFNLQDYISYDEMALSALVGASTKTTFINNGNRGNYGKPAQEGTFMREGHYGGLIGARFEKPGEMEYAHMLVTQEQNTSNNGYGADKAANNPKFAHFTTFYDIGYFPTYDEVCSQFFEADGSPKLDDNNQPLKENQRYYMIQRSYGLAKPQFFDKIIFKERILNSFAPKLARDNQIAEEMGIIMPSKLPGLGIGVWAICKDVQQKIMLEVVAELVTQNKYPNLSQIDCNQWGPDTPDFVNTIFDEHASNDIRHKLSYTAFTAQNSNPASITETAQAAGYFGAAFAWDSNAFVGNEFYLGMLSASGDPAAASCCTIMELLNPEINTYLSGDRTLVL